MASTFSLQGKLGLDARDFKKGAQQASDAIEDIGDEMEDLPAKGKASGSKAGDLLGSGLAKGFAAVGVGALIAKTLNDAMDIEKGVDRVQAQFALTAEEAEKYGELGGELYADAWGESVTDATTSIAKVGQQLQDVGSIADDELDDISAQVMAVADVFQQDFDAVLRSSGQLIRNGLARDAQEAMDLITVAFQKGGDRAGDLLDTIDEYSQHWARLGISGSEALGLISEGFQQGFRDGDKLADMFKEFSIRALEDRAIAAFEAIGLAGTRTQDAIAAGGQSARKALDDVIRGLKGVEDPIERNRIATELFGTQYEDLGPQVLDVLDSITVGLGDVEGASAEFAETVSSNTATAFEEMKRSAMKEFGEIAQAALDVKDIVSSDPDAGGGGGFWNRVGNAIGSVGDALDGVNISHTVTNDLFEWFKSEAPGATSAAEEHTAAIESQTFALQDEEAAFLNAAGASKSASDDMTDDLGEVSDAAQDTADDVTEIEDAWLSLRDEISDRSAFYDVRDAFDDVAAAAMEAADTADKSWEQQDADARDHQRELDKLRLAVIDYDKEVGGLPEEAITDILADIDEGKLYEAEVKIQLLVRDRNLRIQPVLQDPRGVLNTLRRAGTNDRMLADGGPVRAGETVIVGEEGIELFTPKTAGYVHSNPDTMAMMSSSGAALSAVSRPAQTFATTSPGAVINLNVTSLDAQQAGRVITDALNEFYASGGARV